MPLIDLVDHHLPIPEPGSPAACFVWTIGAPLLPFASFYWCFFLLSGLGRFADDVTTAAATT